MKSTTLKKKRFLSSKTTPALLPPDIDTNRLPTHIAIIPDGNGRWAKKRFLNRIKGHEKGAASVRMVVRTSREIGIKYLTLYAFSTENWNRPKNEVAALMNLLKKFLDSEREELINNNIRLTTIGQTHRLPETIQETLKEVTTLSSANDGMRLIIALSYGSREEIVRMVKLIAAKVRAGEVRPDQITDQLVADHLYTRGIPDPDLLIRTSGEMRISNLLLWQIAYAEISVTRTLWPDFSRQEYLDIIKDYQLRDRRFGQVNPA